MPTTKTTRTADQKHRQAFERLRSLLKDPSPSLAWHYEAGKLMLQLLPERAQSEQYGKARIIELRDRLGLPEHRQNFLYAVREFAAEYQRKDLKNLEGLSWSHVHFLLGVRNRGQRDELGRKCLSKNLSCHDLLKQIYELRPHRSTGGRRPADPRPLGRKAALKETVRLSQQWVRQCSFWLDQITPALERAASQRKPDPQLAELIVEAESALAQLHKEVAKWQKALRKLKLKGR